MSYPFVVCFSLAVLLAINIVVSMAIIALWHCVSARASHWPATVRTRLLFALRLFPTTTALVIVFALFVPSYLLYEPRPADEVVGVKLAMLASVSAIGIGMALWRGLASLYATRRLIAEWTDHAEAITIEGTSLPCLGVCHTFPIIAVVGIFSPQLFVSQHLLKSLGRQELLAALEHEVGHLLARDNLKRMLIGCCSDLLGIVSCGRSLDRAWRKSAEAAADEYAARQGGSAALDLASALIKVARMVPHGVRPVMPIGVHLVGEDGEEISNRVRRLAQIAEGSVPIRRNEFALNGFACSWFYLLFIAAVYVAVTPRNLERLHAAMESFFPFLN